MPHLMGQLVLLVPLDRLQLTLFQMDQLGQLGQKRSKRHQMGRLVLLGR
jgi:hypothetical protein